MKKKTIYVVIAVALCALVVAGGVYAYSVIRVTDDEVFRSYIEKGVTATKVTQAETYEEPGSKTTLGAVLDSEKKTLLISADVKCSATVEGNKVALNSTVQQENEQSYYRIDSASGSVNGAEGASLDLATLYSKIKGTWYSAPEKNKAIKTQLDSGAFFFNSSAVAPSYDSTKVVDALINKKAFTYSSVEKVDGNYVISFSSHRDKYTEAVKEVFPDLDNVSLIMDTIFVDKKSRESTITVQKDGTLVREKVENTNLCVDMISTFVGAKPTGVSDTLTGVNVPKPHGSITITPVTNAKPFEQITADFVL